MLGMEHRVISIDPMLAAFATLPGFVESLYLLGNLMARIRMTVLYHHANRDHRLVCGTSNRSECMLGYCTKYGDNAADFQPIIHLYKTEVYEMAKEMKIPTPIIEKTPSPGSGQARVTKARSVFPMPRLIRRSKTSKETAGRPGHPWKKKCWPGHRKTPTSACLHLAFYQSRKNVRWFSGSLRNERASRSPMSE